MEKFKVLGLSGKAGTGKDYIAKNIITPKFGYLPISLSWHFKNWIVGKQEASYEEVFFTKPPRVRDLLQKEGTERGRNVYGNDIWLNTAFSWMRTISENWGISKFVITDVRFENEVKYVQNYGGKVLRIQAPIREQNNRLTDEARKHISETALDTVPYEFFDGYIHNDPEFADTITLQVTKLITDLGLGE